MERRQFLGSSLAVSTLALANKAFAGFPSSHRRSYKFDRIISRDVLDNYLSRSISMEGLLNGQRRFE